MRLPKLSVYQIILLVLGAVLLLGGLIYTIVSYPALPDKIPSHYNFAGEINGYSGKGTVFILAGMNVLMFVLLAGLIFIPSVLQNPNVTWKVDPLKRQLMPGQTVSMLLEMALIIVAFFDYMLFNMIRGLSVGIAASVIFIALVIGSSAFRLVRMYKLTSIKKQPWERS